MRVPIATIQDVPAYMSTPVEFGDTYYRFPAGPPTWLICESCNLNEHRCHFCGDDLSHAEAQSFGRHALHGCYRDEVTS